MNTDYSPQQRRIELIAGEAEFVVAKDKARPFVVVADGQEVKALGSDFIVKKQQGGVSVTVIESAVQVSQPASPKIEPVVLRSGERIDVASGRPLGQMRTVNAERVRAWRDNRLIFEGETLDNVVAEINRYRPGHVFLSDNTLAGYRVNVLFHIDQIDKVLAVIDQTLPVKSMSLGGRFVWLYSK
ncbi:FecR domain-containing protein [Methylomarinum sp. Ch1-1]|uniref:FecR domain-containing protein n=1 Tax=Methylomarinum roseum TaxID=3067653 RepID=A0AAU7NQF5_9GAMM|nr:FecR domain-containing protein [Methylomarinum sp. Ch1-1]MDP4520867.1 FecR domain-containing protein [Methylomarinum sp. Ch1-1]